jgi:hypothetical protein
MAVLSMENCTETMVLPCDGLAVAVNVTSFPCTVELFVGAVIETVGGVFDGVVKFKSPEFVALPYWVDVDITS